MISSTSIINASGQVSIPQNMAEQLRLVPGAEIDLFLLQNGILVKPKSLPKNLSSAKLLKGFLQHTGSPVPLDQLCKPVEYHDDRI